MPSERKPTTAQPISPTRGGVEDAHELTQEPEQIDKHRTRRLKHTWQEKQKTQGKHG